MHICIAKINFVIKRNNLLKVIIQSLIVRIFENKASYLSKITLCQCALLLILSSQYQIDTVPIACAARATVQTVTAYYVTTDKFSVSFTQSSLYHCQYLDAELIGCLEGNQFSQSKKLRRALWHAGRADPHVSLSLSLSLAILVQLVK